MNRGYEQLSAANVFVNQWCVRAALPLRECTNRDFHIHLPVVLGKREGGLKKVDPDDEDETRRR